jgi:hypothetical protein
VVAHIPIRPPLMTAFRGFGNERTPLDQGGNQDLEPQMGQAVFNELSRCEIVGSSPPCDQLKPIADAIGGSRE